MSDNDYHANYNSFGSSKESEHIAESDVDYNVKETDIDGEKPKDDKYLAFRLAVVGSRHIKNAEIVERIINAAIKKIEALTGGFVHTIVSGGAIGVDTIAEEYAMFNHLRFKAHLPEKEKLARGQLSVYKERSKDIVDDSHFVLAIWDGISKGTEYTVKYARKSEKLSTLATDDGNIPKEDLNIILDRW